MQCWRLAHLALTEVRTDPLGGADRVVHLKAVVEATNDLGLLYDAAYEICRLPADSQTANKRKARAIIETLELIKTAVQP